MKTIINNFSRAAFVFLSLFISLVNFAQDKKEVDININTKDNNWYAQPWVWIIGAAVFILLIVALTRGNSRAKG
jgi:cell division protein FtsW (lipid II flippase)